MSFLRRQKSHFIYEIYLLTVPSSLYINGGDISIDVLLHGEVSGADLRDAHSRLHHGRAAGQVGVQRVRVGSRLLLDPPRVPSMVAIGTIRSVR